MTSNLGRQIHGLSDFCMPYQQHSSNIFAILIQYYDILRYTMLKYYAIPHYTILYCTKVYQIYNCTVNIQNTLLVWMPACWAQNVPREAPHAQLTDYSFWKVVCGCVEKCSMVYLPRPSARLGTHYLLWFLYIRMSRIKHIKTWQHKSSYLW